MKKSQIVSYTSEELRQMPDESDWEANAAMTDEEIEAAIASDPEESAIHDGWIERARARRHKSRYVMCIANKGYEAKLTLRRVYKVLPDESVAERKTIKIVDDTGSEDWFPSTCFVAVDLSIEAERNFELVTV